MVKVVYSPRVYLVLLIPRKMPCYVRSVRLRHNSASTRYSKVFNSLQSHLIFMSIEHIAYTSARNKMANFSRILLQK